MVGMAGCEPVVLVLDQTAGRGAGGPGTIVILASILAGEYDMILTAQKRVSNA